MVQSPKHHPSFINVIPSPINPINLLWIPDKMMVQSPLHPMAPSPRHQHLSGAREAIAALAHADVQHQLFHPDLTHGVPRRSPTKMDDIWVIIWIIYIYMDYIWIIYGLYMDHIWHVWVMYGLCMDDIWIIYGSYITNMWMIWMMWMMLQCSNAPYMEYPAKFGLIWYSTSILGSWNSHGTGVQLGHWNPSYMGRNPPNLTRGTPL